MAKFGFPDRDDLLVIRIKRVFNYGAFVDLLEYAGKEGFIHISEVASTWIKNIRNHIKEGQIRVAKVVNINQEKGMVDLSLRRVNSDQARRKMESWKRDKRAINLIRFAAKNLKVDPDKAVDELVPKIKSEFGDLFSVFEEAMSEGAAAVEKVLGSKWAREFEKIAKKSIVVRKKDVKGTLKISFKDGEGVEKIKKFLAPVRDVQIRYISAPRFSVLASDEDPKKAKLRMREIANKIVEDVKKAGGEAEFEEN